MRVANRLLALLVALALLAAGVIFAVEVAARALGQPAQIFGWHGLYRAGERDSWAASGTRALLITIGVVGLLLLVSQLRPHRPERLPLERDASALDAGLSRRAIREVLIGAALDVDGVSKASAGLKRSRAQLSATTRYGDQTGADAIKPEIERRAAERLEALHLRSTPSLRVTVRPGGRR